MKIGILTFFKTINYGAVLQCYALSEYLRFHGKTVFLLDVPIPESTFLSRLYLNHFDRKFNSFLKSYLPLQRKTNNVDDIDVFIVGSDQVWNPNITKEKYSTYFFDFVPTELNKRCISYAASFGDDKWNFSLLNSIIKRELKKFANVSVRELSGVSICQTQFDYSSKVVLDPVFLLSKDDYDRVFSLRKKDRGNIVIYSLSIDSKIKRICKLAQSKWNSKVFKINRRYLDINKDLGGFNCRCLTIENWLRKMWNADFIITDSFHGVAFSIIFEKKFIVISGSRTDRILTLLKKVGLERRFYETECQALNDLSWQQDIDFLVVSKKLIKLKEDSKQFLKDNLI